MRHSDTNLTMKKYTHIHVDDKRAVISELPELRMSSKNRDGQNKTEMDGAESDSASGSNKMCPNRAQNAGQLKY